MFTIPPKKKKKKLFPSFMKVGPNYSHYFGKVAEKRMPHYFGKLAEKRGRERTWKPKKKKREIQKKKTTSFCYFAV